MARELIRREAVERIVFLAGDKHSVSLYKEWSEHQFKAFITTAIYNVINSIDKEKLRTFLNE